MKIISSHTHAFFFIIFQCFEERLHQILLFFKNSFFLQFRSIEFVFRSIEIVFKNFSESLSVSIDQNCFLINRTSWIRFFLKKNSDLTCSSTFSNFSLSLQLGKAPLRIFCRFQPNFLQGFSLPRPIRPLYPSFCFYFHDFMHKLMHFNGIFETFHIWDFCWINPLFLKLIIGFLLLYCYIHDIGWLIDKFGALWKIENSRACIEPILGILFN